MNVSVWVTVCFEWLSESEGLSSSAFLDGSRLSGRSSFVTLEVGGDKGPRTLVSGILRRRADQPSLRHAAVASKTQSRERCRAVRVSWNQNCQVVQ